MVFTCNQPFSIIVYVIPGYSSPVGAIQESHQFLPSNKINGGKFSPAAFPAIETVMLFLPSPLLAKLDAVFVSPKPQILLE
jgi:hypothetical protein